MYLVVGLGNPGKQYDMTRHNIGFHTIDYIADELRVKVNKLKYKALYGECSISGEKVLLIKPQTYMNLSGESIREVCDYYKVDPEEELIVIYDDISLAPGKLRIRPKGSAGGHNGIKSIIAHLGTQNFNRIKVGVGEKPKGWDLADYVLGHFTKEEAELMESAFQKAAEAVQVLIESDAATAMNRFN